MVLRIFRIATTTMWLSDSFRVHQIRFRPGLRPGPPVELTALHQTPIAGLRGLLLRGGETGKEEGKGTGSTGSP